MKRLIALLFCLSLQAATGDITGAAIETNGWCLNVWVEGLNTNGTFAFGHTTSNNLSTLTPKLTVSFTTKGFSSAGSAITYPMSTIGTKDVRHPYPNQAYTGTVIDGTKVKLRIALADKVYSADTALTATIGSGLYTQGTASSAANGIEVTNNSIATYPLPMLFWCEPDRNVIRSSPMTVRAIGAHTSAMGGMPLACVKFDAADQHSHTATTTVSRMVSVAPTVVNANHYPAYEGLLNISAMTSGDAIRVDATAYPLRGDTSFTTVGNAGAPPTYGRAITNVCDVSGTYGGSVARVASGGNNSTGVAVTRASWESNKSPAAFATIAGAMTACKGTNNVLFSHNDLGGSTVFLEAGTWAYDSGISVANTIARASIERHPDVALHVPVISSLSGYIACPIKISGVDLSVSSGLGYMSEREAWVDNCLLNITSAAGLQYGEIPLAVTSCLVSNVAQYLLAYSTKNTPFYIVNQNEIMAGCAVIGGYVSLGNTGLNRPGSNNLRFANGSGAMLGVPSALVANRILRCSGAYSPPIEWTSTTNAIGMLVANNVFELSTNVTGLLVSIYGDGATNNTQDNILLWHNTIVGQRSNVAYADRGADVGWKRNWSVVGNIFDDFNVKDDTFSGYAADGTRIGNWECLYGVNWSGNAYLETPGIGASGFLLEFAGMNSTTATGFTTNSIGFVDRKAFDGAVNMAGQGDYRLLSTSVLRQNKGRACLPFDVQGNMRGDLAMPGAYSTGQPLSGAGFFAP